MEGEVRGGAGVAQEECSGAERLSTTAAGGGEREEGDREEGKPELRPSSADGDEREEESERGGPQKKAKGEGVAVGGDGGHGKGVRGCQSSGGWGGREDKGGGRGEWKEEEEEEVEEKRRRRMAGLRGSTGVSGVWGSCKGQEISVQKYVQAHYSYVRITGDRDFLSQTTSKCYET